MGNANGESPLDSLSQVANVNYRILHISSVGVGESVYPWTLRTLDTADFSCRDPGLNYMALLTVSTESALMEAGNSVLTASVFHRYAANFGFCACVLHVTRHSTLTRLAQKFGACM